VKIKLIKNGERKSFQTYKNIHKVILFYYCYYYIFVCVMAIITEHCSSSDPSTLISSKIRDNKHLQWKPIIASPGEIPHEDHI
jgi:hypothetical protein